MLLGFQLESPVPGEAFRLQQPADSGGEVLLHVEITDLLPIRIRVGFAGFLLHRRRLQVPLSSADRKATISPKVDTGFNGSLAIGTERSLAGRKLLENRTWLLGCEHRRFCITTPTLATND
jgi:hypothetical protein